MYKKILHATDLSENHYEMCEKACRIAENFGATLYLIHALDTPATVQVAQSLGFAETGTPVKDDARVVMEVLGDALHIPQSQLFVEVGSIRQVVLSKLKALRCDLLLIGSHTPHDLSEIMGGTARSLAEHAPTDVMALRSKR